ncbi:MAG TPA: hypothetical protein VD902_01770 [Symbiobacteriaceae bacterium]|nr:hypothetical protein [Symbiobacteriaceae bacterium]
MQAVRLADVQLHLHELVEHLCHAPPGERARAAARLRQRARLYVALKEYLEEAEHSRDLVGAEAAPPSATTESPGPRSDRPLAAPELMVAGPLPGPAEPPAVPDALPPVQEALPALEGVFIRLLSGGIILHAGGEHPLTEAEVTTAKLQHGATVLARPEAAGWSCEIKHPGPVISRGKDSPPILTKGTARGVGHLEEAGPDFAIVRIAAAEVLVAVREMQERAFTFGEVVTVAYMPHPLPDGRYLGGIVDRHETEDTPATPPAAPASARKKRSADTGDELPVPDPESLPRFLPVGRKPPLIVFVGGHPQSRVKFASLLAAYGASVRLLPFNPKARQVKKAVERSDIVIAFSHACRTGHWDTALDTSRDSKRLFFRGESENPSGLRTQLESEIIPRWNSLQTGAE